MAILRGRVQRIQISDDGGTNYFSIGKLVDAEMALETSEIRTTNHDSGAFEESIPNRMSGTISGEARYDRADSNGQVKLVNAGFNQTTILVRWEPEGATSTADRYQSSAWVKRQSLSGPNDDAQAFPFEIQLTGTITKSAIP